MTSAPTRPALQPAPPAEPDRRGGAAAAGARPPGGRHRPSALPLVAGGLVVAALTAFVLVLRAAGSEPPALVGLPDAGPVTEVGLLVSRVALRVLAVACVGALLLAAVLLPGGAAAARAARTASVTAAGWALAALAQATFAVSELLAVPVGDLPVADVLRLLPGLPDGRTGALVGVLAVFTALVAVRAGRRGPALTALLLATAALVLPQVLSGHAASDPDHAAAVPLLAVHVVVATAWVGGLAALVLLVGRGPDLAGAASRFSALALGCFVLTGLTGLASTWVVIGGAGALGALTSSAYGALLLAKTVALVALGAAGWWHRRRTLPRLRAGSRLAFVRFAVAEVVVLLVATGLAVALAGTAPPAPAAPASPGGTALPASTDDVPTSPPQEGTGPLSQGAPEDMSAHDHGELTVGVLVDDERFHVSGPVQPGQAVTVFNRSTEPVTLTAQDGSFDLELAGQTLTTFGAPTVPGEYPFSSTVSEGFADVLVVLAP